MKRIIAFILTILTVSPVFGEVFAPQWDEFCPPSYVNLDKDKSYFLAEKKYWVARKKVFEDKMIYCEARKDKEGCYNGLRQQEFNKNNIYFTQQQVVYQREQSIMQLENSMNQDQTNMYLRNINNKLR